MADETCRTCHHPAEEHTATAGCVAQDAAGVWCVCQSFVAPAAPAAPVDVQRAGLAEGRRLRDEGAERAGDGTAGVLASAWREKAREALERLAATASDPFSADDLVELVGEPPVPNMLGALFLSASRRDVIQPVGFTVSRRPSAHARAQRTWRKA